MHGFFELVVNGAQFLAQVDRFEPQSGWRPTDTPMEVES